MLVALAVLSACGLHFGTGIEAKDTWARSYPVTAGAVLELHETAGTISVEATDGDTIQVDATRIATAPTEDAAKEALKTFTIKETAAPDRVELDSTMSDAAAGPNRSWRVDYRIKVPRSASVTVRTTNSEVTAQGLGGMFRVEAVNAEIRGTALSGGADVTTVNGEISLEFAKIGDASVRCKATNAQIVLSLPGSSKASIAAHVTNGAVETQNLTVQASEQSLTRLNATIGGGGPELKLELTNGEIKIVGK
jgi:hypothetical protein